MEDLLSDFRKIILIAVTAVLEILAIVFFIIGCVMPPVEDSSSESIENPIVLVENITVASSVQNVILQTYKSTLSGVIKNIGDEDITDLEMLVKVKTSYMSVKGSFEFVIDSIKSGAEYIINLEFDSEENFEQVESVYATINGDNSFAVTYDYSMDVNVNGFMVTAFVLCGAGIAVCVIGFAKLKQKQAAEAKAHKKAAEQELADSIMHKQLEQELELQDLEHELHKQELKSQINKYAPRKCPYCDHENDINSKHCSACGASLKSK